MTERRSRRARLRAGLAGVLAGVLSAPLVLGLAGAEMPGATTRASVVHNTADGQADGPSREASISADGRFVAFTSNATNLLDAPRGDVAAVYVRDRVDGTTTLVSRGPGGAPFPGAAGEPSISGDGTRVAFVADKVEVAVEGGSTPVAPGAVGAAALEPATPDENIIQVRGADGGPVPSGTVTFFLCQTDSDEAEPCVGGRRIGLPVPLAALPDGAAQAVAPDLSAQVPPVHLDSGMTCWRAEYSGDSFYRAATYDDPAQQCSFDIRGRPRTLALSGVNAREAFASVRLDSDSVSPTGTVLFTLCAPAQVSAAGCLGDGSLQQTVDLLEAGTGRATANVSIDPPSALGRYCWRVEYAGDRLHRRVRLTQPAALCFVVGGPDVFVDADAVPTGEVAPNDPISAVARVLPITGVPSVELSTATAPQAIEGEPVRITYFITNIGNTRLVNLRLSDVLFRDVRTGGVIFPVAPEDDPTLDPRLTKRVTVDYNLTAEDLDRGYIESTGHIEAEDERDFQVRFTAPTRRIPIQRPLVRLEMSGPTEVRSGQRADYFYVVTNTGNTGLSNIRVTADGESAPVATTPPVLAPGERATARSSRVFTEAPGTVVQVNATVSATPPAGPDVTASAFVRTLVTPSAATAAAAPQWEPAVAGVAAADAEASPAAAVPPAADESADATGAEFPSSADEPVTPSSTGVTAVGDTMSFFLCGPTGFSADGPTPDGCLTGGAHLGDVVLAETSTATLPPSPRPSVPGTYCWRVVYQALDGSITIEHTDSATMCFEVAPLMHVAAHREVFVFDRRDGSTTRVTESVDGGFADGASAEPAISSDGAVVAFTTQARNLTGVPPIGRTNVYTRGLDDGATTLVSLILEECNRDLASLQPTCLPTGASGPSLSAVGDVVAFQSTARIDAVNAATGDAVDPLLLGSTSQIYVRDMRSGLTTLESVATTGGIATGMSVQPSLSGDGAKLAFASSGDNLVAADTNSGIDVFVRDRSAASTARVSVPTSGLEALTLVRDATNPALVTPAPPASLEPSMSLDGKTVAFASNATNLAGPEESQPLCFNDDFSGAFEGCGAQIYVRDLVRGVTGMVSVDAAGQPARPRSDSRAPSASSDGRYVAYTSEADNLVTDDTNREPDVYVRDRTPVLTLVPDPLAFGDRVPGTTSDPLPVTAGNIGSGPVRIQGVELTAGDIGDFSFDAAACVDVELRRGSTCVVQVRFTPTAEGPRAATLTFTNNAGPPQSVRVTGNGVVGRLTVTPDPVEFGDQIVGTTGDPRVLSLLSIGTAPVDVTSVVISGPHAGDFLVAPVDDTCSGRRLLVGRGCGVVIRFRPSEQGPRTASAVVTSTGTGSPQAVTLQGNGTAALTGALTAVPQPLDFGVVPHTTVSEARTVTVTNGGPGTAEISGVTITGDGAPHYRVVAAGDGCSGTVLSSGASCQIQVEFAPTATGAPTAELEIASDTADSPIRVTLLGRAPLLRPDPALGRPGFVTSVTGQHFPPNTEMLLVWSPGLGTQRVVTDAEGRFRSPMVVMVRDRLGPRLLQAVGPDFTIEADFLVVPGSAQPGDFVNRR